MCKSRPLFIKLMVNSKCQKECHGRCMIQGFKGLMDQAVFHVVERYKNAVLQTKKVTLVCLAPFKYIYTYIY